MIETKVEIVSPHGLHTRPAATIVRLAAKYSSEFFLTNDDYRINGKSIIGVMTMAAAQGSFLELEFEGPDEEEMASEIVDYFKRGFDEI